VVADETMQAEIRGAAVAFDDQLEGAVRAARGYACTRAGSSRSSRGRGITSAIGAALGTEPRREPVAMSPASVQSIVEVHPKKRFSASPD